MLLCRDNVGNTIERNLFPNLNATVARAMWAVNLLSNKILQLLTGGGCWLTAIDMYNGHKMVVVVVFSALTVLLGDTKGFWPTHEKTDFSLARLPVPKCCLI